MNKLSITMLVGAMAMSTVALADTPVTQGSQTKSKDCAELSGKKKDKCVQATPAGPVNMTTGKQKKGKSEVAKDRDNKLPGDPEPHPSAQTSDSAGTPQPQPPTGGAQSAAKTGNNASKTQ